MEKTPYKNKYLNVRTYTMSLHIENEMSKKKENLLKEGCLEMAKDAKKINKEWESADEDW